MSDRPLPSFADQFRAWYAYERDCNAKCITMLQSVPQAARSSPGFARAVGKLAHLAAARNMWLYRLGVGEMRLGDRYPSTSLSDPTAAAAPQANYRFPAIPLEDLPAVFREVEEQWTAYLSNLTDADLAGDITFAFADGKLRRWRLLDLLTQVFGHAWYHRGQIAMLVKDLGGEAIDTDYIFWNRPTEVGTHA